MPSVGQLLDDRSQCLILMMERKIRKSKLTSLGSVVGRLRLRDVYSSSGHGTDENDGTGGVSAHHVLGSFTSSVEGTERDERN